MLNNFPVIKNKVSFYHYPDNSIISINLNNTQIKRQVTDIKFDAFRILKMCDGTKTVEKIIQKIKNDFNVDKKDIIKFLNVSINNNFIELKKLKEKTEIKILGNGNTFFPKHVSLELTNHCNLFCNYCYNESGPENNHFMDLGTVKKLFKLLKENGLSIIEFTGGEPMLHPHITEIIKCALENFQYIGIISNGVYFPDEVITLLGNNKYAGVQISIDGSTEEITSKIRGKKNTYDKSLNTIKKLQEAKINLLVTTVVTLENVKDLKNMCELVKSLRVKDFGISIADNMGRAATNPSTEMRSIKDKIKNDYNKIVSCIFNDYKDIIKNQKLVKSLQNLDIKNCGAGWSGISVDSYGNVKPCPPLDSKNVRFGNLLRDDYMSIFNDGKAKFFYDFTLKSPEDKRCSNCKNKDYCGGCFTRVYLANKKRLQEGEGFCQVAEDFKIFDYFNF